MVKRVRIRKGGWQTPYSAGPGTVIALLLFFGASVSMLPLRGETNAVNDKHRFLRANLPFISSSFSTLSTPSPDWHHKTLWPLDTRDYVTLALATIGLILAAGEGMGGGVILVPLFILVLDLPLRRAIPLSNVTILGGALANTWHSLSQSHPQANRQLVDWNMVLMIGPTAIVSAVAGTSLNKILPEVVIYLLLVAVLAALATRVLQKGLKALELEGRWAHQWYQTRRGQGETAALLACPEGPAHAEGNASLSPDAMTQSATPVPAPARAPPRAGVAAAANAATGEGEAKEGEGRLEDGQGGRASSFLPSWIGTIEDQEVVGVSDYGAILSTPPSSAARTRTPTPSKAKKKVLLTPVMVLQSEEEGGRAGGEEEDMWSSPFEGLFSPRRGSSLSPSKGKNRVLLTPITPERQREGGGWKVEEEQEWEQAEEVKEEWVSRERGEFKDDMSYATHVSSAELDIMTEEGGGGTDWWKPLALGVCFLGVIVADVLKGGKGSRSPLGITCGSQAYWLVMLATLPWVGVFLYKFRQFIMEDCAAKLRSGYNIHMPGEVWWTRTKAVQAHGLGATAGLAAGVVGIGDIMIEDILLLEMGVLPAVAAASAAVLILYTAAAAAAAFCVFGQLSRDYGALFFVWGLGCTLVGRMVVSRMVRQHNRESLILLSIGAATLLSVIMMGREGIREYTRDTAKAVRMSSMCE
ncbi:hypothetical protein VYU27_007803 [Nannochloropsis oceanica]